MNAILISASLRKLMTPIQVIVAISMMATAPIQALASGGSSKSSLSGNGSSGSGAPDVCESRRVLTMEERDILGFFNADLSWLARYRSGADKKGVTYQQKFNAILTKNESKFKSEELKDAAGELILFEQFTQVLFTTVGLENPEFTNLTRNFRVIEYFTGGAPRELREAIAGMQKRIITWNQQQLTEVAKRDLSTELKANQSLQVLAQTENIFASLDVVAQTLNIRMDKNAEQINDKLASYHQYFTSLLGGAAVVGTLAVSGPVVSTASAGLGAAGVFMAGCGIGAAGGGAAALLQRQYQSYADAWIESANRKTSYACELRRAVESNHESLFDAFREGAIHGGIAGCVLTGSGMVAAKATVYGVTGAVVLATGVEGTLAVKDAYLATRTYSIYRSLIALQQAELSADQPEQAAKYLRQAQEYSKTAGAHLLNSILVGIVLTGGPKEISHAIHNGREAIVALIGKSSDNAAVAVSLGLGAIQDYRSNQTSVPANGAH